MKDQSINVLYIDDEPHNLTAFKAAFRRDYNIFLAESADQARQILDRIVGFELSPVVWRKVPGGKSAGRVQSPAVRLLVEREREIQAFKASSEYKVSALFYHDGQEFKAELGKKLPSEEEARAFLESLRGATFSVSDIVKKP